MTRSPIGTEVTGGADLCRVAIVCSLLPWLLGNDTRVHGNCSHHRSLLIRLAVDGLHRIERSTVIVLSMTIARTRLSHVTTEHWRMRRLGLGMPNGLTCSKTKFFRPDVLMDTIQLLQVLGKLEISLRYGLEVIHCKAYVRVWIQDRVMISPLCLELGEGKRCLASVPDLSTVPSGLIIDPEIVQGEINDLLPFNLDVPVVIAEAVFYEIQVQLEYCARLVVAQWWIV